jgi:hypothetical protein
MAGVIETMSSPGLATEPKHLGPRTASASSANASHLVFEITWVTMGSESMRMMLDLPGGGGGE